MCRSSAKDGNAQDWHLIHLGNLSLSRAGLLIYEATAVSTEGQITPGDPGLCSNTNERVLRREITAVKRYALAPMAIQLGHSGRKASSHVPWESGAQIPPEDPRAWTAVAPSGLPHAEGEQPPDALDAKRLAKVRDDFASATRRASDMGFSSIKVHMAHGYLLHQFLSPLSNQRTDDQGGSLDNRLRFQLEVFDVRQRSKEPTLSP